MRSNPPRLRGRVEGRVHQIDEAVERVDPRIFDDQLVAPELFQHFDIVGRRAVETLPRHMEKRDGVGEELEADALPDRHDPAPPDGGGREDITVGFRRPRPLAHRGQDDGGPHAFAQDIEGTVRMRCRPGAGGGTCRRTLVAGHARHARPEAAIRRRTEAPLIVGVDDVDPPPSPDARPGPGRRGNNRR